MEVTKQVSKSVPQRRAARARRDRRAAESNRRINQAFFELIARRPFGLIRVGEIARRARVGRATFYAHYASKEALLRAQFEQVLGAMLRLRPTGNCPVDATAFLAHIRHLPQIYRGLMLSPDAGQAPQLLRRGLESHLGPALARRGRRSPYLAGFVAGTLLGLIETWLEAGLRDPDWQVQAVFQRLMDSGLA